MANTVDVDFSVILSGGLSGPNNTPRANLKKTISKTFASNLTSGSLADQVYGPVTRTLAAGANETLDFSTGLLNLINLELTGAADFAKIRAIVIEHDDASLASAIVVGNGSNPFGGLLTTNTNTFTFAKGEGVAMWSKFTAAGMTVDGTHKTVKVTNSDGSNAATYSIYVLGSV